MMEPTLKTNKKISLLSSKAETKNMSPKASRDNSDIQNELKKFKPISLSRAKLAKIASDTLIIPREEHSPTSYSARLNEADEKLIEFIAEYQVNKYTQNISVNSQNSILREAIRNQLGDISDYNS